MDGNFPPPRARRTCGLAETTIKASSSVPVFPSAPNPKPACGHRRNESGWAPRYVSWFRCFFARPSKWTFLASSFRVFSFISAFRPATPLPFCIAGRQRLCPHKTVAVGHRCYCVRDRFDRRLWRRAAPRYSGHTGRCPPTFCGDSRAGSAVPFSLPYWGMAGWGNGQGTRHVHLAGWRGRHGRRP